jgi:hypothetical protein
MVCPCPRSAGTGHGRGHDRRQASIALNGCRCENWGLAQTGIIGLENSGRWRIPRAYGMAVIPGRVFPKPTVVFRPSVLESLEPPDPGGTRQLLKMEQRDSRLADLHPFQVGILVMLLSGNPPALRTEMHVIRRRVCRRYFSPFAVQVPQSSPKPCGQWLTRPLHEYPHDWSY